MCGKWQARRIGPDGLELPLREWEYRKLDLNDLPRKGSDIDVLNEAGKDAWELVTITVHHIAYVKREVPGLSHARTVESEPKARRGKTSPKV